MQMSTIEEWNKIKMREKYQNHMKQIEQWTGLKYGKIIFDSDTDDWNQHTSVFDQRITFKKCLTFLIEDENGELFGYYLNTFIDNTVNEIKTVDDQSFHFNLLSNNKRLQQSMKFEVLKPCYGGYSLYDKSNEWLMRIGNVRLKKMNIKNQSYCEQCNDWFNYHDIENALCGKIGMSNPIQIKKILVIQMIK